MSSRAVLAIAALAAESASSQMLVMEPAGVGESWPDHGSGSAHDVTVYAPAAPEGFSALGAYAQAHDTTTPTILAVV